jgi:hypothetical protein
MAWQPTSAAVSFAYQRSQNCAYKERSMGIIPHFCSLEYCPQFQAPPRAHARLCACMGRAGSVGLDKFATASAVSPRPLISKPHALDVRSMTCGFLRL